MTPSLPRAARLLAGALLLAAPAARAQVAEPPARPNDARPWQVARPPRVSPDFDLSVRNLMRGEALIGRSPDEVRWSDDSRAVWFRWRRPDAPDTLTALFRVPAAGGDPAPVPDDEARASAPAAGGWWTPDRRRRAFERGGDIFVWDARTGERRITDTPGREQQPHLSPDGRTLYFRQGANLFALALDGAGPLRQLTDLRAEDAPRRDEARGSRAFLEAQQRELFGVVRDRRAERERRERLDSLARRVPPVFLGRNATVTQAWASPSGRYVLLAVVDRAEGGRQTMVPDFVTESGYTEPLNVRGKVGDPQGSGRVAVLDLEARTVAWVEPAEADRRLTWTVAGWAPTADRALLQAVPADFKDRWTYVVDGAGRATVVDALRDTAWVGGPAFFQAGWVSDDRAWFVSERSGWSHVHTVAATGGEARAVTSGAWEVTDVDLSPDRRAFWITTSETHRGERNLYHVPVDGGARTRVTPLDGWTTALPSPDGRWLALLHSTSDAPPELWVMPNRAGARPVRVTESRTAEFRRGPWIRPEVLTFPARDGAAVHARIYRPRDLGAAPNGAAVLFVHGAGYLQNAHRGWSTYSREYLFHHLLASRGYTVMDVDYRGSAGYGAAWRTGIYRHMGGKDLTDHVDAARWLVANEGVDPARVGIYGGSYGGFITLMAMFTEPEVFRSGAALRSVTDWAHYNHPYTARILNQPQDDTLAYRRSSPIHFAEGLRGDLLIAHGMVDVNVHFQDVVRLTQRLIELEKTNWELAVYPVEDHAFTRPESWTDEYRRILALFDRTLLPGSPAPASPR